MELKESQTKNVSPVNCDKTKNISQDKQYKRNGTVHFVYAIAILSVILGCLVAFIESKRISDGKIVMEFISNVSTILSIVLSIFAIQYTYFSNAQIQQQFEKIDTAANHIASTSKDLTVTGSKINESFSNIMNKLDKIDSTQQDINNKLGNENTPLNNLAQNKLLDNTITP